MLKEYCSNFSCCLSNCASGENPEDCFLFCANLWKYEHKHDFVAVRERNKRSRQKPLLKKKFNTEAEEALFPNHQLSTRNYLRSMDRFCKLRRARMNRNRSKRFFEPIVVDTNLPLVRGDSQFDLPTLQRISSEKSVLATKNEDVTDSFDQSAKVKNAGSNPVFMFAPDLGRVKKNVEGPPMRMEF
eukprot:snap_masked-scaffold_13-processed-gene-2.27-mRNA-1 protein AED:1.00 eAED:1.00 QI:0/0/0/0/1/1/2/0/185